MKVLYFHQHFSTPKGSTGTRSYEQAIRMIAHGHKVTMVCGSYSLAKSGLEKGDSVKSIIRRGNVDGIDVIEIRIPYSNYDGILKRAFSFTRFALKSISIAWKEDYDLLYATSTPLTAGIPGIVMKLLKPRKQFVFEVRDLWPELPRAMGMKNPFLLSGMSLLEKLTYLSMDAGVALSPGILEGMRKRTPQKTPIIMIPNGCDLDFFHAPVSEEQQQINELAHGIPKDGLKCVFAGAHGLANGLDAVLNAAKILKDRHRNDISLIFIGDGKLKPSLIKRKNDEGLSNCIFLDPLPKEKLKNAMSFIDVGLMILANIPAFYYGTSPNKFFDYIAIGLPVLNNYPGWIADLIEKHNCGIAVSPNSPIDFANALEKLADNPDLRKTMGKNAKLLAEKLFDRNELADQLIYFLENLLKYA